MVTDVQHSARDILDTARALRASMTGFLADLVAVESSSTRPETQRLVLQRLAAALSETGYRTRLLSGRESGGMLYARPARRRKGAPVQLLLGHCDTVWPVGTLETMPLQVEETRVRGPGVYDMKGGLTQMVFALAILDELDLEPAVTPVVLVNSDEEVGSRDSTRLITRLSRISDRVLVLEPSLGREGRLKTARKGVGRFTVEVTGVAAHAGLDPEGGASAILELSHVVQQLHALNDAERGVSVNVGQIHGGLRPNVVAPVAGAVVDVRVPTEETARSVESAVLRIRPTVPGTSVRIEGTIGRPPMERTPRNRRLWDSARSMGLVLGIELQEGTAGGGSDGNTASRHAATLDGLGAIGDGAHASHEFALLDALIERTALLALLVLLDPLTDS